jgi:hypothetical protein
MAPGERWERWEVSRQNWGGRLDGLATDSPAGKWGFCTNSASSLRNPISLCATPNYTSRHPFDKYLSIFHLEEP